MGDQPPPRPPLGLKLTKTPALLEQIQMILSRQESVGSVQEENAGLVQEEENVGLVQEENAGFVQEENAGLVQEEESVGSVQEENAGLVQEEESVGLVQEENIGLAVATKGEKRKACNFHASVLRIGSWEWTSKNSGDLVAKIYFGKQKLIWEVMKEGLKSKMEFSWSDIKGLKTYLPENQPGTLTIVLTKPPFFYKETNPQPQKPTKWELASDFTNGQAGKYKQHVLQCGPGIMNKHIESLLQSDHSLFKLSQEPGISLDSPFFDVSGLEESDYLFVNSEDNILGYTTNSQINSDDGANSDEEEDEEY